MYAAGLCTAEIDSYSDWYLPAICQMGYGNGICGGRGNPSIQNIASNLFDMGFGGLSIGTYWPSTQNTYDRALIMIYQASGGRIADSTKFSTLGVRCTRNLDY